MSRLRPFLAVLLAVLLLGAQQGAVAHLVGHVAGAGMAQAAGGDPDHGASLAHPCATCLAYAALDGAASAPFHLLDLAEAPAPAPGFRPAAPPSSRPLRAHPARAPPAVS